MNDVIARYLDCWNETDPVARRKVIEDVVEGRFFSDFAQPDKQKITEAHPLRRRPGLQFVDKFVRYVAYLNHG